jgi:hypothetical protein
MISTLGLSNPKVHPYQLFLKSNHCALAGLSVTACINMNAFIPDRVSSNSYNKQRSYL